MVTRELGGKGRVVVVMGVSGCGKTRIGQALAEELGAPFYDGDDFHPASNVAKMHAGTPLTDSDRLRWLDRLNALAGGVLAADGEAVIACSALRRSYRERLAGADHRVRFVFLEGRYQTIRARMTAREGHFFPETLLRSQFEILERPTAKEAVIVGIEASAQAVVAAALRGLSAS